jgi:(2Fe-2S) ferredoxin
MQKPRYHLFVCNSYRTGGEPQGVCHRKGSFDLLQYLQTELGDRGLDAMVTTTGCLNACEKGPIMIVYPDGWWYYEVTQDKVDEILDALEQDQPVPALLMT